MARHAGATPAAPTGPSLFANHQAQSGRVYQSKRGFDPVYGGQQTERGKELRTYTSRTSRRSPRTSAPWASASRSPPRSARRSSRPARRHRRGLRHRCTGTGNCNGVSPQRHRPANAGTRRTLRQSGVSFAVQPSPTAFRGKLPRPVVSHESHAHRDQRVARDTALAAAAARRIVAGDHRPDRVDAVGRATADEHSRRQGVLQASLLGGHTRGQLLSADGMERGRSRSSSGAHPGAARAFRLPRSRVPGDHRRVDRREAPCRPGRAPLPRVVDRLAREPGAQRRVA